MAEHAPYDPVKQHAYYERTKQLKGRRKGSAPVAKKPTQARRAAVEAKVGRLRATVSKLQTALSAAEAELSSKRQKARKTAQKSHDGKTTAKERAASKQYREKHKAQIKAKEKSASSHNSKKATKPSNNISDMSVHELQARITKIKSTLRDAKRQLSQASQELGQLAHSAILAEPNINEHFAVFLTAEGIPSK